MPCCCAGWCTTRTYEADGTAVWQAPGTDSKTSSRNDIAVDQDGNAYTVFGKLEKIDDLGNVVYSVGGPLAFPYGPTTLTSVAVEPDASALYLGAYLQTPHDNVYKIDPSDGSVIASATIGVETKAVYDIALDGSGGVYFAAGTKGVAHFDSSFNRLADVGCVLSNDTRNGVTKIAVDDAGNLYTASDLYFTNPDVTNGSPCSQIDANGCEVYWTIKKYNSAGVLQTGTYVYYPTALAVYGGFVYVGFSTGEVSPVNCNIMKLDATTLECVWSSRIGEVLTAGFVNYPERVPDIAVNENGLYAIAGNYLFKLDDADGSVEWCRKNEGEEGDPAVKTAGPLKAIALQPSGGVATTQAVWATGRSTPCSDAEESACESGTCENRFCECNCGSAGRFGGTIVNCDCEEVPCEFETTITSDCELLNGSTIHWERETNYTPLALASVTKWRGTLTSDCGSATFIVEYDCDSLVDGGWSITATGIITSVTITDTFCTDTAPAGFSNPGFIGTFTVASGTCDDCEGCLAFGTDGASCPPATVDLCGCTGIPQTLTATITSATGGCSTGATATLTYDGSATWTGSFSCGIGATLSCSGGSTWVLALTDASCFLTASLNGSGSCSPFSFAFGGYTYLASGSCTCCSSNGSITITVTA